MLADDGAEAGTAIFFVADKFHFKYSVYRTKMFEYRP